MNKLIIIDLYDLKFVLEFKEILFAKTIQSHSISFYNIRVYKNKTKIEEFKSHGFKSMETCRENGMNILRMIVKHRSFISRC